VLIYVRKCILLSLPRIRILVPLCAIIAKIMLMFVMLIIFNDLYFLKVICTLLPKILSREMYEQTSALFDNVWHTRVRNINYVWVSISSLSLGELIEPRLR